MTLNNIAIYIHWPFCKSKCPYCDFNSHVREKIDEKSWFDAYITEISFFADKIVGKNITSIFFGGGTPSLMNPKLVEKIILELEKIGKFVDNIEITLEANPTSIEAQKFQDFKTAGINRVSIGIQSFNEEGLKFLGRTHSKNEAIEALEIAGNIFSNYSFDLIYARPNQSIKNWENELLSALKLAKNHLSLYQLTIEKGTSFFNDYRDKKFTMPSDVLAASMYELTREITKAHGFVDYEISNYAKQGFESKHNLSYWNYDEYLGIGPGSHSRIDKYAMMMIHNPENLLAKVKTDNNGIQAKTLLKKLF